MKFEKEYFRDIYKNYQNQNPKRKLNSYLKGILEFKKSGKLLDIGCAYGSFIKLARKYFLVQGIDTSEHAVSISKKRGLDVRVSKAENTGFGKDIFDVVCMFDVIEHVPNLSKLIKEIRKILKKGGLFVISIPVYDKLAGKIVKKIDKDPTHIHKKPRKYWIDFLNKNGFEILLYKGILRYFLLNQYYIHKTTKLLRKHMPAIYVIARKK